MQKRMSFHTPKYMLLRMRFACVSACFSACILIRRTDMLHVMRHQRGSGLADQIRTKKFSWLRIPQYLVCEDLINHLVTTSDGNTIDPVLYSASRSCPDGYLWAGSFSCSEFCTRIYEKLHACPWSTIGTANAHSATRSRSSFRTVLTMCSSTKHPIIKVTTASSAYRHRRQGSTSGAINRSFQDRSWRIFASHREGLFQVSIPRQ